MTARFLASRGARSHLPASEAWIQRGGVRKLDESLEGSFRLLLIVCRSVAKAAGKSIWRRAMPAPRETLGYIRSARAGLKFASWGI